MSVLFRTSANENIGFYGSNLAETFSSLKAYKVGDYVLYNGVLYVCKTNHNGTWNESNWTREYVIDILADATQE